MSPIHKIWTAAYPESTKLTGKSSIRKTQISGIILTYSITNYLCMIGIIDVVFIIGGISVLGLGAVHSQITPLRERGRGIKQNFVRWVTRLREEPKISKNG